MLKSNNTCTIETRERQHEHKWKSCTCYRQTIDLVTAEWKCTEQPTNPESRKRSASVAFATHCSEQPTRLTKMPPYILARPGTSWHVLARPGAAWRIVTQSGNVPALHGTSWHDLACSGIWVLRHPKYFVKLPQSRNSVKLASSAVP